MKISDLKKKYLEPCQEYIDSLDSPPIFLHIRQSDNIGREEYHPILPIRFFESALGYFDEETPCFVFTDDLEWCKNEPFLLNMIDLFFNDNPERYEYQTIDGTGKMQNTFITTSGSMLDVSVFWWYNC